ncbi:MAG: ribbon-helix-helix domain-containing protein [Alphaproteobacteria bacterium]
MTVSVELPEELENRLKKLAQKTHRSKSSFVSQALEEYLEDQEDYYDALERKKRLDKGLDKPVPWTEIKKAAGLK